MRKNAPKGAPLQEGKHREKSSPKGSLWRILNQFDAERVGIAVAIAAPAPVVVFAVWFAESEGFRKFAMSSNPRILTALQMWRLIGFTFLLLQYHSVFPAIFAMPTGYGDMTRPTDLNGGERKAPV